MVESFPHRKKKASAHRGSLHATWPTAHLLPLSSEPPILRERMSQPPLPLFATPEAQPPKSQEYNWQNGEGQLIKPRDGTLKRHRTQRKLAKSDNIKVREGRPPNPQGWRPVQTNSLSRLSSNCPSDQNQKHQQSPLSKAGSQPSKALSLTGTGTRQLAGRFPLAR